MFSRVSFALGEYIEEKYNISHNELRNLFDIKNN